MIMTITLTKRMLQRRLLLDPICIQEKACTLCLVLFLLLRQVMHRPRRRVCSILFPNGWSKHHSMHNSSRVEHANPFIPSTTGRPPLRPKETPIHARHKFRMSAHPSQLPRLHHPSILPLRPSAAAATITPHPARHVVASAEQQIGQMRRPCHFSHCVVVSLQELKWAGRLADVEGADHTVYPCHSDNSAAIFVPVVCQGFTRREGRLRSSDPSCGVRVRVCTQGWRVQWNHEL